MIADFEWASPGGVYVVPTDFKRRFLAAFPGYRIRWSLQYSKWLIEQPYAKPLPALTHSPFNDDLIRLRDGFWLVLQFQPGDRMACQGIIQKNPRQICGYTIRHLPHFKQSEVRCQACRIAGRDGRNIGGYFPFSERLIDYLKATNPLTYGIVKSNGKIQTRAALTADQINEINQREAKRRESDVYTSIDAVDYRWLSGIASSTGLSRHTISDRDLL